MCEWDESDLSWASFRQDVIGATDPLAAKEGSCRAEMLRQWKELGLTEAPGMPNNGVHVSVCLAYLCSPFSGGQAPD